MINQNLGKYFGAKSAPSYSPSTGGNGFEIRQFGVYDRELHEPTILTCLKIITNAVGSLPVHCAFGGVVYKPFDDRIPSDVAKLIRRPNQNETTQQLMAKVAANMTMTNEAYLQFKTLGGTIKSIECIPSSKVSRSQNSRGEWVYTGTDNQNRVIISGEIVRIPGVQIDNQSMNILKNSRSLIDLSLDSINSATKYHKSGPKNAGFVVTKSKLNDEQYARVQSSLDSLSDEDESGRIRLLENMEFVANPFSMKDSGFNETRDQSVETIAMLMGVPLQLLGGTGDSSFKDLKEVRAAFLGITINPILVAIENAIHDRLNYKYQIDFQEREYLNSDYEARAKLGMEMFKLGLASNIEARELADMDNEGIEEKFVAESNNLTFTPTQEV